MIPLSVHVFVISKHVIQWVQKAKV